MKEKVLSTLLTMLLLMGISAPAQAGDDVVMITRDGSWMSVKIDKISSSDITFVDLDHKRRGKLNAPTDFVYMLMKEKGSNTFFDEDGNQTTSPVVKLEKKDNVMFLNEGEMFVIYNVSVGKEEVKYQLKDKKKEPWRTTPKKDIFMIHNADGTNTLYNNSYQEKRKQQSTSTATPLAVPTIPTVSQPTVSQPQTAVSTSAHQQAAAQATTAQEGSATEPSLLASTFAEPNFHPAPELSPADIERAVNTKNPYTLYRKGSVAEYCFQVNGKRTQWMGGPTYLQQIVYDEKIENGLLVAYIQQALFNKNHEPSKGIAANYKDCIFPTEIDTAGVYHLTHNLVQDFLVVSKRRGYGIVVPSQMTAGMQLACSTLYDDAKNLFGGIIHVETAYSNWKVEGEERITTPAGTFDCVKLTGRLAQKQGSNGKFYGEQITCWLARGIGIVQYETISDANKKQTPFVVYLNKIELK